MAAPGLPPWPRLYFDRTSRSARVALRHPTWQSHQRAIVATKLIVFALSCWATWRTWTGLAFIDPVGRVMFSIFAFFIGYFVASSLLQPTLRYFLARRVFATKTTFWFTPEAIAFRSRLYGRPVRLWRKWHGQAVRGRFIIQPDPDVPRQQPGSRDRVTHEHLNEAMMLEMVITTAHSRQTTSPEQSGAVLRSIPITEINSRLASKVTMVCAAAAMLTAPTDDTPGEPTTGGDIDAL